MPAGETHPHFLPPIGRLVVAIVERHAAVIGIPEAKKGFVLLPRRWVVERSFGWLNRFRRLARDYERLSETLAGLHFVVVVSLMRARAAQYF